MKRFVNKFMHFRRFFQSIFEINICSQISLKNVHHWHSNSQSIHSRKREINSILKFHVIQKKIQLILNRRWRNYIWKNRKKKQQTCLKMILMWKLKIENNDLHVILSSRRNRINSFFKFQLIQNNFANEHVDMWKQCAKFFRIKLKTTSIKTTISIFDIKISLFHFQFFVVKFALKKNKKKFDRYETFINDDFDFDKMKSIRNQWKLRRWFWIYLNIRWHKSFRRANIEISKK